MSRGISWMVDATKPSVERKDTMYYEAVSQCTRMLRNIGTWLDKAEKHAAAKTFDVSASAFSNGQPATYGLPTSDLKFSSTPNALLNSVKRSKTSYRASSRTFPAYCGFPRRRASPTHCWRRWSGHSRRPIRRFASKSSLLTGTSIISPKALTWCSGSALDRSGILLWSRERY
jgi:hypothetical protein